MIYRRLDNNYDYSFGNGKGNFLSDAAAVAQAVMTRLKLFLGEWILDRNDGLPVFQSILGYNGRNKETVDRLITERILDTQGVVKIVSINSSYESDTRAYKFNALIETIYGQIALANEPFLSDTRVTLP